MIDQPRQHRPALPVRRACALLELSPATYYHRPTGADRPSEDRAVSAAIEEIVLEYPGYGYRRVTPELRRRGRLVNHKRVRRLMGEQGLCCRQRRRWRRTTDSRHGLRIYPNRLADCGWRQLTGVDQAWVADITYLRLPRGFAYLAAILDAYSRRVVGWQLSRDLDARFVVAALERALAQRQPPPGWIHHSDRGVQYACREYVERLQAAGAQISMTSRGAPRENAQAESFFRTLKYEEVYLHDYQTYGEAERQLRRFIDDVYNEKRLHSSLGYVPPSEFEQQLAAAASA